MSDPVKTSGALGRAGTAGGLLARSAWRRFTLSIKSKLVSDARRRALAERARVETAEDVARVMGNLKGAMMKIGQVMSFATDDLPPAAAAALRTLQKDAPPMGFDLVRKVLESELGDIGSRFKSFDELPLASASIGQVHGAKLHDGTDVVVKVQYPGVDEAIEGDLVLLRRMGLFARMAGPNLDPEAIIEEVSELLRAELDYTIEADNQETFAAIWGDHPLIRVPRVIREHSARRVLCQTRVTGLDYYAFLEAARPKEKQLAAHILSDFVFDSLHVHRQFHGDPHPGNYLFQRDGGIAFLDYGCVRRFDDGFIAALQAMLRAVVAGDRPDFVEAVTAMGVLVDTGGRDEDALWDFFAYHLEPILEDGDFTYDAGYKARQKQVMRPGELRKLGLPRELVVFNRITFGLNALQHDLGATANFHRIYRRYMHPEAQHPPALALVGLDLPDKYLRSTPEEG